MIDFYYGLVGIDHFYLKPNMSWANSNEIIAFLIIYYNSFILYYYTFL